MENDNMEHTNYSTDDAMPTQNIAEDDMFVPVAQTGVLGVAGTTQLIIASFYLPGHDEPIIVNGERVITIGRRDPKRRISPTIDLTEDQGAKLGVSRMHAEMNFVNDRYYLKDTGSSNGTWVNDTKLQPYQPHPVATGDQIRIGQLAIVVHLSLPQRDENGSISTMIDNSFDTGTNAYRITDTTGGILVEDGTLVISKLRGLSTYLERLSRIHTIIREAQNQPPTTFTVKSIRVRSVDQALIIDIGEGKDFMDFMADKLGEFLVVRDGKKTGDKKQTDSLQRYTEPLQQIADYALQELVFRFLNEQRDDYVNKLAPHFDAILTMELAAQRTTN